MSDMLCAHGPGKIPCGKPEGSGDLAESQRLRGIWNNWSFWSRDQFGGPCVTFGTPCETSSSNVTLRDNLCKTVYPPLVTAWSYVIHPMFALNLTECTESGSDSSENWIQSLSEKHYNLIKFYSQICLLKVTVMLISIILLYDFFTKYWYKAP